MLLDATSTGANRFALFCNAIIDDLDRVNSRTCALPHGRRSNLDGGNPCIRALPQLRTLHPLLFRDMAGNNVVWQPEAVEEMLRYFKEKIQTEGRQMVFKEVHHEECAQQVNAKCLTNFTQRQVYHKFHKLKAQWKVILEAKNLSGANFDDVEKRIIYDKGEVVRMTNSKDKRAKFTNVPIRWYDEMEFIFQDKHATGEFTVIGAPYDHPMAQDDFIGEKNGSPTDVDPSTQYDSD